MLESVDSVLNSSLIYIVRQLIAQNKHRMFKIETFLSYLRNNLVDQNINLAQVCFTIFRPHFLKVFEFWQKNGGIPNLYVEKIDERVRLIQMNNGRKAQLGSSNWIQMPLWPLHISIQDLVLPTNFMISQGK